MALSNPGNQYMSLIAGIAQEPAPVTSRLMVQLTSSDTDLCAAQTCGVIVDSKVVVGRRRRRRAGVRRHRPQGQSSPLWPQWAAAWPLVPLRAPSSGQPSGPSELFSTICIVLSSTT